MKRKKQKRRKQKRKWKFTKKGRERYCESCPKKLKPDEHFYCKKCWGELTGNNLPWYE